MRDSRSSYSLDRQGLVFACKVSLAVVLVFGGVHFGTTRASEYIIASSMNAPSQPAAVASVIEAPAPHPLQTTLAEYERTLSARSTGGAAFDTIVRARTRMLGIHDERILFFENGAITLELPFPQRVPIPTGLAVAHPISDESAVFPRVGFPGCAISAPVPTHETPCITLSTDDAKRLFDFVGMGTPVFVVAPKSRVGTPPEKALPRVSAKAFIVADLESGIVYAAKDAETARPIASISKLFTALVARETIRDDRTMTVTREDQSQTEGVPGSIRAGESFTVDELLYPLLMESNNSAAYTLARYEGTEQFIERMNQKVAVLDMSATKLDDASGLSPNNVSSPRDLVTLLQHIQKYHSILFDITGARTKTLRAENGRTYGFSNFNHFAGDKGFVGGKTGFINEAGQTYAGVFEVPQATGTSTIAIIVLGSEDRKKDAAALLSWFRDR